MRMNAKIEKRFWSKVDKGSKCWMWTAGKNSNGYGNIWLGKRCHKAHRVAYEIKYGSIPKLRFFGIASYRGNQRKPDLKFSF